MITTWITTQCMSRAASMAITTKRAILPQSWSVSDVATIVGSAVGLSHIVLIFQGGRTATPWENVAPSFD